MRLAPTRRALVTATLCAGLALAAGACGGGDDGEAATTTTTSGAGTTTATTASPTSETTTTTSTTTTSTSTTTTTTAPSTTTTTAPVKISSPEDASQKLYAAWKAGDRAAAGAVAEQAAVATMFALPYSGPDPTFAGCAPDGLVFACTWLYEGGARTFRVTGSAADGYRVASVTDIAD